MKVSIIINTYNRLHTLPTTLEALRYLRYRDYEVIVVNGPSTDGTLDYLNKNWSDKAKILECPEANLSMSRNIGICAASGDIVAFTDDDGIPEPDWLDNIIPAYDDPNVAAVGGFVRNHTGVEYQTKFIKSNRHGVSEVMIDSGDKLPEAVPGAMEFTGLIGVNSTFRRDILIGVGGFDIEYAYFLEETDVIVRLVDAGYKIIIVPEAEVHHKYASSHIRNEVGIAKSWFTTARSTAYYCLKNAPNGQILAETLKIIGEHRTKIRSHTEWAYVNNLIDKQQRCSLIESLNNGIQSGISDAFAYPHRRLIQCGTNSGQWKTFPSISAIQATRRLAFITDLYPPRPCGGIAVFIHSLAKTLAKHGHEITVITLSQSDDSHTVDFEEGVWVHRIPVRSHLACVEGKEGMPALPDSVLSTSKSFLAELLRIDVHRRFDWVIGTIWDMHLAAIIASKKWPVAMYLVTTYQLMLESKPEWRLNKRFFNDHVRLMIDAERWALEHADVILSSTSAILNDVEKGYGYDIERKRVYVQPFGVLAPTVKAIDSDEQRRFVTLLFVGRFETRKGIDVLLDIVPDLLTRNPDLRIELIGDHSIPAPQGGTYLSNFQKKHQGACWLDRLCVPGVVSDEELEYAYSRCDIFVAPSRYESFGLIYIEAMRYGKPCVGCDAGGVSEVVLDRVTGLLVQPGEPVSLYKALMSLVESPDLRRNLGTNGLQRYHERFTISTFANGILAVLNEGRRM